MIGCKVDQSQSVKAISIPDCLADGLDEHLLASCPRFSRAGVPAVQPNIGAAHLCNQSIDQIFRTCPVQNLLVQVQIRVDAIHHVDTLPVGG